MFALLVRSFYEWNKFVTKLKLFYLDSHPLIMGFDLLFSLDESSLSEPFFSSKAT